MTKPLEELLKQTEFSDDDIVRLLGLTAPEDCLKLKRAAYDRTTEIMGDRVFYRGLIELSNICTDRLNGRRTTVTAPSACRPVKDAIRSS